MNAHAAAIGSPVISVAYGNRIVANPRMSASASARPGGAPTKSAKRCITTQSIATSSPVEKTIVR